MRSIRIVDVAIAILIGLFIGGIISRIPMVKIIHFLNSNLFVALVTLSVGSFAIFLYKKQQKDNKRDAASLILQEIRYAEQQIRNTKRLSGDNDDPTYALSNKLLPTNSWHKNIHLFVNDLTENQIDLISLFYSQAAYLDEVISIISSEKNKLWKELEPVQMLNNSGVFLREKALVLPSGQRVEMNMSIQVQLNAKNILSEVTKQVEFIYNSPAVDRLRRIAGSA